MDTGEQVAISAEKKNNNMTPELLSVLPNLSVGVVSIGALVYITMSFLKHLKEEGIRNSKMFFEKEEHFRGLEKEVRGNIMTQLGENTRAFERVMEHFKLH